VIWRFLKILQLFFTFLGDLQEAFATESNVQNVKISQRKLHPYHPLLLKKAVTQVKKKYLLLKSIEVVLFIQVT